MRGTHEPGSSASFYISLGTATLRIGLVAAAVVLGTFVLSRAFPDDTVAQVPEAPQDQAEQPPEEPPEETEAVEQQPPDVADPPSKVTVQVLNGTEVTGLAAGAAEDLKRLGGYRINPEDEDAVGDSRRPYDRTRIFYRKDSRLEAEELRDQFFADAALEERPAGTDRKFRVTVVLGTDYAEKVGG